MRGDSSHPMVGGMEATHTSTPTAPTRRVLLGAGLGSLAVAGTSIATAAPAAARTISTGGLTLRDGHGLTVTAAERWDWERRLVYVRFATKEVTGWGGGGPGVNVLLPAGYDANPGRRYPVIYAFHGGGFTNDFTEFHKGMGIVERTAQTDAIVVMPDGGHGSFYIDAKFSTGHTRNWETFHIKQLVPWIDANLRTIPTGDARAAFGISMGGYGALKYGARFPKKFSSVTAISAPSDTLFFALQIYMYGAPAVVDGLNPGALLGPINANMDLRRANDPQSLVERYRGTQMNLYTGLGDLNPVNGFNLDYNEDVVAPQTWYFAHKLQRAGIERTYKVYPNGGHNMATWGPAMDDALPRVMHRLTRA